LFRTPLYAMTVTSARTAQTAAICHGLAGEEGTREIFPTGDTGVRLSRGLRTRDFLDVVAIFVHPESAGCYC